MAGGLMIGALCVVFIVFFGEEASGVGIAILLGLGLAAVGLLVGSSAWLRASAALLAVVCLVGAVQALLATYDSIGRRIVATVTLSVTLVGFTLKFGLYAITGKWAKRDEWGFPFRRNKRDRDGSADGE
jgi:hypothetical protein